MPNAETVVLEGGRELLTVQTVIHVRDMEYVSERSNHFKASPKNIIDRLYGINTIWLVYVYKRSLRCVLSKKGNCLSLRTS